MNTEKYSLVLRACNADMSSRNGFVWPTSGPVECSDWKPIKDCGNGLHGWLHGHGNGDVSDYWEADSKWLVVKVENKHIVDLKGKVKFEKGNVVFCGDRKDATDYLIANDPLATTKPVIGAMITTGDNGTSISGDYGTSTSGYNGTATSGYYGTATSGRYGTSTSGENGTSTSGKNGTSTSGHGGTSTSGHGGTSNSGDHGTSTSGDYGTSTSGKNGTSTSGYNGKSASGHGGTSNSGHGGTSNSGDHGTATSGDRGTSTSGENGKSTSGENGKSTSGDRGTSTSGENGKSTSGDRGTIIIRYWKNDSSYLKVGYIGEDGLEPNVAYKLDNNFEFVKA